MGKQTLADLDLRLRQAWDGQERRRAENATMRTRWEVQQAACRQALDQIDGILLELGILDVPIAVDMPTMDEVNDLADRFDV